MADTAEVMKAIEVVKRHLDEDWISEGCNEVQSFGCASCQAVQLRKQLTLLGDWLLEDEDARPV